jgi:hypothetical protein
MKVPPSRSPTDSPKLTALVIPERSTSGPLGSDTRGGQGVDVGNPYDESVKPGDPRTLADRHAAVADRGDEVREADLPALACEKQRLPCAVVLRHRRGSVGEAGDEREAVRDPPGVPDPGDARARDQQTLLFQRRQFGLRRTHCLAHVSGADERGDLREQLGMGTRLEDPAARRAVVLGRNVRRQRSWDRSG